MSTKPPGDITDSEDDDLPAFLNGLREKSMALFARQAEVAPFPPQITRPAFPAILKKDRSPLLPEPPQFPVFPPVFTKQEQDEIPYVKPTYRTIYPEDFEMLSIDDTPGMVTRGKSASKDKKKKPAKVDPPTKKRKITPEKSVSVYQKKVLDDRRNTRSAKKIGRPSSRRGAAAEAPRPARNALYKTIEYFSDDDEHESGASEGSGEEYEDIAKSPAKITGKKPKKTAAKKTGRPKAAPVRSAKRKRSKEDDSKSIASSVSASSSHASSTSARAEARTVDEESVESVGNSDDEEDWQATEADKPPRRKKVVKRYKRKGKTVRRRVFSIDPGPGKMRRKRYYTTEDTKKCSVCMRAATSMPRIPCAQCTKPVCPMCRSKDENAICPTCWVDNSRSADVAERLKGIVMKGTWTEEELRILVSKVRSTRPQKLKNLGFQRWVGLLTALEGRTVSGVWKTLYRSGEVGSVYQSLLEEEIRAGRLSRDHNHGLESVEESEEELSGEEQ